MDFTWSRVDLVRSTEAGVREPGIVLPRSVGEQWVVCQSPISNKGRTEFTLFADEEQFYVPLYPYLLHREPDLAFAAMFSYGMKCVLSDVRRVVKRLHVVTGVPVVEVDPAEAQGDLVMRYWLGFGMLLG